LTAPPPKERDRSTWSMVRWLRLKTYAASGFGSDLIFASSPSRSEKVRMGKIGPKISSSITLSDHDTGYRMVGSRYRADSSKLPPDTSVLGSIKAASLFTASELINRE